METLFMVPVIAPYITYSHLTYHKWYMYHTLRTADVSYNM